MADTTFTTKLPGASAQLPAKTTPVSDAIGGDIMPITKPAPGAPNAKQQVLDGSSPVIETLPGSEPAAPVAPAAPGGALPELPTAPAGTENLAPISYTAPSKSSGLIDSAMNYDFKGAAGEMKGPTEWNPTDGQLVENRLTGLIDKGGDYMARAGARAKAAANSRGLINSSMGVQAGQAAAIDAALPIAQQDAATLAQAGQFNANAANSFASEDNAFGRQGSLAKFGVISGLAQQADDQEFRTGEREGAQDFSSKERVASQLYGTSEREASQAYGTKEREGAQTFTDAQRKAQNAFQTSERGAAEAWQANQNQLSRDFQRETQKEQAALAKAAQSSEAAMRFVSAYYDNVNQILRDPNLDPEVKQAQITKALENTKASLNFLNLSDEFDLDKLLTFA